MKATDLEKWMRANKKTAVDVASITRLSVNTVLNFLARKSIHRSTLAAFERLVRENPDAGDKAVAG